eukprot:6200076-Pleurochrysis_carterae.AAC.4
MRVALSFPGEPRPVGREDLQRDVVPDDALRVLPALLQPQGALLRDARVHALPHVDGALLAAERQGGPGRDDGAATAGSSDACSGDARAERAAAERADAAGQHGQCGRAAGERADARAHPAAGDRLHQGGDTPAQPRPLHAALGPSQARGAQYAQSERGARR